ALYPDFYGRNCTFVATIEECHPLDKDILSSQSLDERVKAWRSLPEDERYEAMGKYIMVEEIYFYPIPKRTSQAMDIDLDRDYKPFIQVQESGVVIFACLNAEADGYEFADRHLATVKTRGDLDRLVKRIKDDPVKALVPKTKEFAHMRNPEQAPV
ncbi:MAG: hypothetical protein WCY57_10060, partial [Micavibrio sp.]